MAPLTRLSEKAYMSLGLVAMIVSLAFWTGKLDTTVAKHETEIAELKKSRDEADRLVAGQLSVIAQDVATIKGMLRVSQVFERDARVPRRP